MQKFLVYLFVGSLSALIDVITLYILISLNTTQRLAVTIAFIAGFVFNINAHSIFTFANPLTRKSALKFTAVVAINYLLALLIIETLTALSSSLMAAKAVSLPFVAVSGYSLGRHWAFKV